MASWLYLAAVLAIGPATSIFNGPNDDLLQLLCKKLSLKKGGSKFLKEYIEFRNRELPDTTPAYRQHYDFVVVGAGSAGSTIASRLTELEQVNVLLIEAGGHENLLMDVPLFALFLQLYKDSNWDYLTEPSDNYCRSVENLQCKYSRGKVMGGTSVLNFMIATRGNRYDYDEWAEMTEDPSWSYDGMLKYFKKLETFDYNLGEVDPEYHGFDGPVRIANAPYRTPLADAFIEAGREFGLPEVEYNGRQQTGFGYMQTNQINGERLSANRAYLHPARNRTNLSISMHSHVTKILIDPKTKTAWGVEFIKFGRRIQVVAKKEVILSAGGISSPQILMLSGIGPAKHLRSLNIEVIQDAPVGENMKDHIAYGGLFFNVNQSVGIVTKDFLNPTDTTLNDYLYHRTGKLATAGGCEGLGYVNVDDPRPENDRPNIELMFGSVSLSTSLFIRYPFGIIDEQYNKFFADSLYKHAWIIFPLLMKPKSSGQILLRSKDPFAKPRIYPNYLSDPDDVRVAIQGIRWAIKVSRTRSMQEFGSQLHDRTVPGCEDYQPDSDAYWECALRTFTVSLWHNTGTCKMGPQNDPTSVVNSRLQVKGVSRLRVADASIMPNIVTAHTHIPTVAVAEKFSDIIKKDWHFI